MWPISGMSNPSVTSSLNSHADCWTSAFTDSASSAQQTQCGSDSVTSTSVASPYYLSTLAPDFLLTPPAETSPTSSPLSTSSNEMASSNRKSSGFAPHVIHKPEPCHISSPFGVTLRKLESFEEAYIKELQPDHVSNTTVSTTTSDHCLPLTPEPSRFQPIRPGYQDQVHTSQPDSTSSASMKHFYPTFGPIAATRSRGFHSTNLIPNEIVAHNSSDPVSVSNHSAISISAPESPVKHHKHLNFSMVTQPPWEANSNSFRHLDLAASLQRNYDSVSWWNKPVRSADGRCNPLQKPSSLHCGMPGNYALSQGSSPGPSLISYCAPELPPIMLSQRHRAPMSVGDIRRCHRCRCPNCMKLEDTAGKKGKKQHSCHVPGCSKVYSKTSHLKAHLRWHSGERPYACNWFLCRKTFTRSDELQRHIRIHTDERRFVCKECGKGFTRSDHLSKHAKIHLKGRHHRMTSQDSLTSVIQGPNDLLIDVETLME